MVEFGLLGPLLVGDGGKQVVVSAPRQRVLLAALLLSAGRVVSVDALAEVLWDGQPPAGARGALHSAIQRLRSALGPAGAALIATRPPGYVLHLGDGGFDVRQFGVLAARGQAAAGAGSWVQAADLLWEALGLWRGEALADIPSQALRAREVPPLEDERLQVLGLRIDADLRLGRHREIASELRQLVAAHPLLEHFHAQLMLALYRSGRQGDALAAYQDARRGWPRSWGWIPAPSSRICINASWPPIPGCSPPRRAARPPPARPPGRPPRAGREPGNGPWCPGSCRSRPGISPAGPVR